MAWKESEGGVWERLMWAVENRVPSLHADVVQLTEEAGSGDRALVVRGVAGALAGASTGSLVWWQHLVWEKLNTGHWSEVWRGGRLLYGAVVAERVHHTAQLAAGLTRPPDPALLQDLVRLCDLGILLGGPDVGNLLEQLAQTMSEALTTLEDQQELEERHMEGNEKGEIDQETEDEDTKFPNSSTPPPKRPRVSPQSENPVPRLLPLLRPLQEVPTLCAPSIPGFLQQCRLPGRPTKLLDCLTDWPAVRPGPRHWTPARLVRLAGHRTVPVEIGRNYTDHGWTQRLMTVRQFADQYLAPLAPSQPGYLAQHRLLEQVPALAQDIITPDYCYTGESEQEPEVNVWIGPAGTVSPAHTDKKENLLCQVAGSKYVALFLPSMTQCLYPGPPPLFSNTSQVELERPDLTAFPLAADLQGSHTVLGPGEMLYIPAGVWHYVRSLEQSFSVSFWWQ